MRVEVTRCDNPTCPEVTDDEMYGWLVIPALHVIGSGPTVKVEVCSVDCLSDGADAAIHRWHEDERERQHAQSEGLKRRILEQDCPTCGRKPGYPCITTKGSTSGKEKPEPHAARREAGRAAYYADKKDNPQ